jgi:hypothetical protein
MCTAVVQKTGTDDLARKALVQKDYDWLLEAYPDIYRNSA